MESNNNLTAYELWQMEKYGNILPEPASIFMVVGENEVQEMSQREANYIFQLENPK